MPQVYYNYFSHATYRGSASGKNVTVPAPLDSFPLLIRGGSIIPTRARPRRSSTLMRYDPFTLTVALDRTGGARGEIYLDDGVSYSHEKGELVWKEFKAFRTSGGMKGTSITATCLGKTKGDEAVDGVSLAKVYQCHNPFAKSMKSVEIEKILVLGLTGEPKKVSLAGGSDKIEWTWKAGSKTQASELVIKKPKAFIAEGWTIDIE